MELLETLSAKPAPLQQDDQGVFRVGGTRVRLDSVIGAFQDGSTAEEILLKYPALRLTDIYAVITYYLWHTEAVEAYLEARKTLEEKVRQQNEARFPRQGLRERLLARRASKA